MTDEEFSKRVLSMEEVETILEEIGEDEIDERLRTAGYDRETSAEIEVAKLKDEIDRLEMKISYFQEYMYIIKRKEELERKLG